MNDPTGNPPPYPGGDWWKQPEEPTMPYDAPPGYGPPGQGAPGYGPPPGYGPAPGYGPPQGYGGPSGPPTPHPQPPRNGRKGWLIGAAAALAVALVGTAGAVAVFGGDGSPESRTEVTPSTGAPESTAPEPSAAAPTAPVPTGSFNDRLSTSSPTAKPSAAERKRILKDVDAGLHVYDDVYVKPASGWKRTKKHKQNIMLTSTSRRGGFAVMVIPAGISAARALPLTVGFLIKEDEMTGVRKSAVRTVRPANSNLSSQAIMNYSGRVRTDGLTVSVVVRCTTMTGVESIHNVTVTSCVVGPRDDPDPSFRDSAGMFASVARSI